MLKNCSDLERLQITQKLSKEVLSTVADGTLLLNEQMEAVLKDSLEILASKEIKITSRSSANEESDVSGNSAAAVAKASLISKIVKKNTVENLVPVVIGLKIHLEKIRSPIMRQLMFYLRELVCDYKEEISDIMTADRQLGNEIMFDLQKFEDSTRANNTRSKNIISETAAAVVTPILSSVHSPICSHNLPPGSPGFTVPKLRASIDKRSTPGSVTRSNLSHSVSDKDTHKTKFDTPNRSASKQTNCGGRANRLSERPCEMTWVRTPKRTSAASADMITLQSPLYNGDKSATCESWNVCSPCFSKEALEKREHSSTITSASVTDGVEDPLLDDSRVIGDENVDLNDADGPKPGKRQTLSKAAERKLAVKTNGLMSNSDVRGH